MKQIISSLLSVILACAACYNGMSQTYDTSVTLLTNKKEHLT